MGTIVVIPVSSDIALLLSPLWIYLFLSWISKFKFQVQFEILQICGETNCVFSKLQIDII